MEITLKVPDQYLVDQDADELGKHIKLYAALRINDPNQTRSGYDPVPDLGERFTGPTVGREHLNDEVGGELGEAIGNRIGKASAAHKRDIRRADGVWTAEQRESGLGSEELSCTGALDVNAQLNCQVHRNTAVSGSGRFPDYQSPPHELATLIGDIGLQELFRGHERTHARNVSMLAGHGQ